MLLCACACACACACTCACACLSVYAWSGCCVGGFLCSLTRTPFIKQVVQGGWGGWRGPARVLPDLSGVCGCVRGEEGGLRGMSEKGNGWRRMCQFVKSSFPTTPTFFNQDDSNCWLEPNGTGAAAGVVGAGEGARWGRKDGGWRCKGGQFGPGRGSQMWEVFPHLTSELGLWSHLVLVSW